MCKKITREEERNLNIIIETINGLKLQSEVALNSNGDNKLIDKNKLKEAHLKITPAALQYQTLKIYMKEKNIVSYIDINTDDFKSYYIDRCNN